MNASPIPGKEDRLEQELISVLSNDQERLSILKFVATLNLPDCWIGAGFIRNVIWDKMHAKKTPLTDYDIDVIYFSSLPSHPAERLMEEQLRAWRQDCIWSVTNQARAHLFNNDAPYSSSQDALSRWPEVATCVAARWFEGRIEILAPYGVSDIFHLKLRPNFRYPDKYAAFKDRVNNKGWLQKWPQLSVTI